MGVNDGTFFSCEAIRGDQLNKILDLPTFISRKVYYCNQASLLLTTTKWEPAETQYTSLKM